MDGILGFILASLALAGSPGPATLSLAAIGAAFGIRRGLGYMTGIIIGMIAVMAIIATGLMSILLAVPGAMPIVAGLAAAYFVYLAFRIATAPPVTENAEGQHQPSFAGGMFLSLVNPKGYAAMAALFSGFVLVREHVQLDAAAKLIVLVAIITAVNVGWLYAGSALTPYLCDRGTSRIINVGFAILLVVSAAFALAL